MCRSQIYPPNRDSESKHDPACGRLWHYLIRGITWGIGLFGNTSAEEAIFVSSRYADLATVPEGSTLEAIQIRQATSSDGHDISEFNRAMARETENRELEPELITAGVNSLMENPTLGFYVVAEAGNTVVGCLMVTSEWSDWRNGLFWWIQSVYVLPDYRRRGIYRRMYQFVKELAAENPQVCGFRLYVERDNAVAKSTYASLGMEETPYQVYEELMTGGN